MTVPAPSGIWTVFGCNLSNKGNNNKKSLPFFFFRERKKRKPINYRLWFVVSGIESWKVVSATAFHLCFESYLVSNRKNKHSKHN